MFGFVAYRFLFYAFLFHNPQLHFVHYNDIGGLNV